MMNQDLLTKWIEDAKKSLDEIKANPLSTEYQIKNAEYKYANHVTRLHHINGNY